MINSLCAGKPSLSRQKILSMFKHTTNVHHFSALPDFPECLHDEIEEERPWMTEGICLKVHKHKFILSVNVPRDMTNCCLTFMQGVFLFATVCGCT